MRMRYLAAWCSDGLGRKRLNRLRDFTRRNPEFALVVERDDLIVLADRDLPFVVLPDGVILGQLFAKGEAQQSTTLNEAETSAISQSRGGKLIDSYWGCYIAILPSLADRTLNVLRAPLGDLGCYYQRGRASEWLVASDAAFMRDVGDHQAAIAWDALARHLANGEMVLEETCLTGVREVRGGDRLEVDAARSATTSLWSPWTFAAPSPQHHDAADAAAEVRFATQLSVEATASSYNRVLMLLSGGLDSSIVAACLAAAGRSFSGMTLVTPDPAGDERRYARIAAAATHAPLTELFRDTAGVDPTRSLAADLPRPGARGFTQETERLAHALANEQGADAIFDGGGGDNVFCSHRSVAAVADCLRSGRFGSTFWATARSLGDLGNTSIPSIVRRAAVRAWLRPTRTRKPWDVSLLTSWAAGVASERREHPWLFPPAGALPGQAVHISLLATAQALVESTYSPRKIDRVSPLVTQPVAEACLKVPSWLWFAPGHDRATARRAFANDLPRAIIDRRSKGTPAAFVVDLLDVHRPALRALLLDGALVANTVIDPDAVRLLLDDPAPPRGFAFGRLLQFADAEAWARCWL